MAVPATANHAEPPDFLWEAPLDFEGDLIIQFTYEVVNPTWCSRRAIYASEPSTASPVILWTSEGGSISLNGDDGVHVEALGIDERVFTQSQSAGSLGSYSLVSEPATWTIIATGLKHWDNPILSHANFRVEITCDEGGLLVRDLAGSRELVTFKYNSMQGTGVIHDRATLQVADYAERTFASEQVMTYVRAGGHTGAYGGVITHTHPSDTEAYPIVPVVSSVVNSLREGGHHRLEVTRASAGLNRDSLLGFMGGLTPLESFDELL